MKSAELVRNAYRAGLTIPAFNIPYFEMMEPIIRAVVDQNSFAFLEVARPDWMHGCVESPSRAIEEYRKYANRDHTRMHLDHVPVLDECGKKVDYVPILQEAIDSGFDSIMIDGSRLSLEENIRASRQAADMAHKAGIACEAELGMVLGHEAGPLPPYETLFQTGQSFTNIDEAKRFVDETQCDWLSVAVGNVHGAIAEGLKDQPKVAARINLEHLESLRNVVQRPMVLHGGSGIITEYVRGAIKRGISKINVGTEVRQAYEQTLAASGDVTKAQEAVYNHVVKLIVERFCIADSQKIIAKQTPTP